MVISGIAEARYSSVQQAAEDMALIAGNCKKYWTAQAQAEGRLTDEHVSEPARASQSRDIRIEESRVR
jgi:hypothetical protein